MVFLGGGSFANDGLGGAGNYANCSSSATVALTKPCRMATLYEADRQIISNAQRLIKLDLKLYEEDPEYKRLIDEGIEVLREVFDRGVEISDDAGLFDETALKSGNLTSKSLIDAIIRFPASHAGCNFTLQRSGVVPFARSFIVAYLADDEWKFVAVHFGIENPEQLITEPPSSRKLRLNSIKTRKLVPGVNAGVKFHCWPE